MKYTTHKHDFLVSITGAPVAIIATSYICGGHVVPSLLLSLNVAVLIAALRYAIETFEK